METSCFFRFNGSPKIGFLLLRSSSKNMVINWHMKTRKLFTTTGCSCCPPACFFSSPELMDSFFQQLSVVDKQFSTDAETCSLQQQSTILSNTEKSWGWGARAAFHWSCLPVGKKELQGVRNPIFRTLLGDRSGSRKNSYQGLLPLNSAHSASIFTVEKQFVWKNRIFPIWEFFLRSNIAKTWFFSN